jgi:hypothetical protein
MLRSITLWENEEDEPGCAYIVDEGGVGRACGALRRGASPYCATHHALCHVANGSPAEANRLREVEALAKAVGGRRSREGGGPSRGFLRRLERATRVIL